MISLYFRARGCSVYAYVTAGRQRKEGKVIPAGGGGGCRRATCPRRHPRRRPCHPGRPWPRQRGSVTLRAGIS